ncbi:hypothetical protein CR513_22650, partial [Mucuna pruriens]
MKRKKVGIVICMRETYAIIVVTKTINHMHVIHQSILLKLNLLSFKDIHLDGYYIERNNEDNMEYLYIVRLKLNNKKLEKLPIFLIICTTPILVQLKYILFLQIKVKLLFGMTNWVIRNIKMHKIIENTCEHLLKRQEILQPNNSHVMLVLFPRKVNNLTITRKKWE